MLWINRPVRTLAALGAVLTVTLAGCSGDDETGPREPGDNLPPALGAISVSPETIHPDSLVTLAVAATDPNGDPLTYRWTATGGAFTGDSTSASVTWRAPDAVRSYSARVVVSDGWRSAEESRILTVTEPPNRAPSTRITRMLVTNHDGTNEILDFAANPPTIRDSSLVTLYFDGEDTDGFVNGFRYRIVRRDIVRQSILAYPYGDFFDSDSVTTPRLPEPYFPTYPFTSNDYWLVVQSRDDDGAVDAAPDSVYFEVNFSPALDPAQVYPGPDELVAWTAQDSLRVRFRADDVETPAVHLVYRVALDGAWGARVGPVDDEADLEQAWPMPDPGAHEIEYLVEDPGLRVGRLTVTFHVVI